MLKKMKPKTFTEEQLKVIQVESAKQTINQSTPKSADPDNFPVFDIPINTRVLVYVPNCIVEEDGVEELRMDKPLIHMVMDGKRFGKLRCIRGLSESTGYSGNCPLCDGESEPWTLANLQIKEACKVRGLDINDSLNDSVKELKRNFYSSRVIKSPDQYYTFPIVVIETDPNDIKKIISGEDGKPLYKIYWYQIAKSTYNEKWLSVLEGLEDEPSHPGGHFFVLNYTYESKSGDYNKRDSAKAMKVIPKNIASLNPFKQEWDKAAEEWTPAKSMATVYDNMYYEEADLEEEADRLLVGTREKIAIYESMETTGVAIQQGTGFNLGAPPQGLDDSTDDLPMVGQTDKE